MPKNHNSMICKCGGEYRPDGAIFGQASMFEPHFDPTVGKYLTSWREKEKEGKKHGLVLIPQEKINKYRSWKKQAEDLKQEAFKKDGFKYKPGSNSVWSDKHEGFIKRNEHQTGQVDSGRKFFYH